MIARVETISLKQARAAALHAQGFGRLRQGRGPAAVRAAVGAAGLLQIDSVNVLARAHYLPVFARVGAYDPAALDALAWGRRPELFEYWAHEASLVPMDLHPLFRWRMARARRGEGVWGKVAPFAGARRAEAEALLERIRTDGPSTAADLADGPSRGGWWGWSEVKTALEWLFWTGDLAARSRRPSFERVYDLAERVLPAGTLERPTPTEPDAVRALLALAAARLGVAAPADLREFFRLPGDAARRGVGELLEAGALERVRVEGSDILWVAPPGALEAPPARGAALLAPFDPLLWSRPRAERLFGARIRLEIYVPQARRVHGYYVLPLLLDGRVVARVDLKADRTGGRLLIRAAHREDGSPVRTARVLARELRRMADWLGLEAVAIAGPAFEGLAAALEG